MEDQYLMNRLANCKNPYQGEAKRVLCVCSAGLLRSPTLANVLSREPYNYNTRAAGITKEFALIPVDEVLLTWADEIVCMDRFQREGIGTLLISIGIVKPVISLDIPDNYRYMDNDLIALLRERYNGRNS